jgi:short-subunit dehydrogenase
MVKRRSGQIVNIGSVVGITPTPWSGIYNSSKARFFIESRFRCVDG